MVVILWTDVKDGKGGVTAGGADRMTGDGFSLLSAALAGSAQVSLKTLDTVTRSCTSNSRNAEILKIMLRSDHRELLS